MLQAFKDFITSPCLDQPFHEPHEGHPSHKLWQTGNQVRCGTNFHKECKGAGLRGSPPIHSFFQPAGPKAAAPTPEEGTTTSEEAPTAEATNRPTPRRLHFPTPSEDTEEDYAVDFFEHNQHKGRSCRNCQHGTETAAERKTTLGEKCIHTYIHTYIHTRT